MSYLVRNHTEVVGGHLLQNTVLGKTYPVVNYSKYAKYLIVDETDSDIWVSIIDRIKYFSEGNK